MSAKTTIGARLAVEGIHRFPQAVEMFGEEVKFLQYPHRHQFHITIEIEVFHDDRDQEFFVFQREVKDYLHRNYGYPVCNFGTLSCEAIGRDLMEAFNATMVEVSEDGENYSRITLNN